MYRGSAEEKQPLTEAVDSSNKPEDKSPAAQFIAEYALSILKKFMRLDNASLASRVRTELEREGLAVHFPSMEISHAYNTGLTDKLHLFFCFFFSIRFPFISAFLSTRLFLLLLLLLLLLFVEHWSFFSFCSSNEMALS